MVSAVAVYASSIISAAAGLIPLLPSIARPCHLDVLKRANIQKMATATMGARAAKLLIVLWAATAQIVGHEACAGRAPPNLNFHARSFPLLMGYARLDAGWRMQATRCDATRTATLSVASPLALRTWLRRHGRRIRCLLIIATSARALLGPRGASAVRMNMTSVLLSHRYKTSVGGSLQFNPRTFALWTTAHAIVASSSCVACVKPRLPAHLPNRSHRCFHGHPVVDTIFTTGRWACSSKHTTSVLQ